ncbi:glycosyl hydrolase family 61-domain-containing protein [Daedaleopsis nitida]|nr:glycosyl hydrolase family 61-domain-containing protein [Daedaleopsis nitida]
MYPYTAALLAIASTLIPDVAAHGFVKEVVIDGKLFAGNFPFNAKNKVPSPIRFIDTTFPVIGASNPAIICGPHEQRAPLVVAAKPGSQVQFRWNENNNNPWPHQIGPLITYMALCQGTTCDKFDASKGRWFKIDQQGKRRSSSGDANWAQSASHQGKLINVNIPQNLKAGDYLIRHEIISLHNASSTLGAQFYPSCTQVRIAGAGTAVPRDEDIVKFPGAYSDTEPGLHTTNVGNFYKADSKLKTPYEFPGPAIATLVSSASAGPKSTSKASETTSKSEPAAKSTSTACAGKRMVKRSTKMLDVRVLTI